MNCLFLNVNVCHFFLIKNTINFQYSIFNSKIKQVPLFKDLGIIFCSKLNFSSHTEVIKNNAFRNLGFIKRTCRSFLDTVPLKYPLLLPCSIRFRVLPPHLDK